MAKDALALMVLMLFWTFLCKDIFAGFFTHVYSSATEIDAIGQFWMSWWAQKAMATDGMSLFFCPLLNAPIGAEVFTFDVAFVHILISALLRPMLGMAGSINALFVYGLALSLVGTYAFLRQITTSRILACSLAAIPVIYTTALSSHIDIEQVNFGYVTLALALWIHLQERGGKTLTIITGLLIGITCITQMYYGVEAYLLIGLAVLGSVFGYGPTQTGFAPVRKRSVAVMVIGAAVTLPILAPSVWTIAKVDVFKPLPLLPGAGIFSEHFLSLWHLLPLIFMGFAVLIIACKEPRAWFWLGAFAMFLLLAFGPYLVVDNDTKLPMPFWFLRQLVPLFWRLSMPVRFGRMALIVLMALFAVLQMRLFKRYANSQVAKAIIIIVFVYCGNFVGPMMMGGAPTFLPVVHPVYADPIEKAPKQIIAIGNDGEDFTIFDLRCDEDAEWSAYYQIFHEKPISGTPLLTNELRSLAPPSAITEMQRALCIATETQQYPPLPEMNWWKSQNVRYMFLASSFIKKAGVDFMSGWDRMYGPPVYVLDRISIYDLRQGEMEKTESLP